MQLRLSVRALLATCAAVLVGAYAAGAALASSRGGYDANDVGQPYREAALDRQGFSGSDFPDLVAVVGDHGVEGFVRAQELSDDPNANPATPEEALAIQAKAEDRILPVFAADGLTQVDTFTVWGPNHDVPIPNDDAARRAVP